MLILEYKAEQKLREHPLCSKSIVADGLKIGNFVERLGDKFGLPNLWEEKWILPTLSRAF